MTVTAGDWAAFMTASAAQPEATPATAPAAAVVSQDSGWDAFQSGEVATPAGTTAAAAVPFDPFGESQSVGAAPLGQQAAGAPAAGVGASQSMAPKHAAKKSADDIMKMFDTPQQSAFAQFPSHGMSQGQTAAMPGGFAMQQVPCSDQACRKCSWHDLETSKLEPVLESQQHHTMFISFMLLCYCVACCCADELLPVPYTSCKPLPANQI